MTIIGTALQTLCTQNVTGSLVKNCKLDTQFLDSALLPYDYILGGVFAILFWATIVGAVYIRYRNGPMAALLGITVAFTGSLVIPNAFYIMITLMMGLMIATSLYYILRRAPRPGE